MENVFGKIFDYVIFNDVTDSKRSILKEWENRKDVIWIEDKYTNYETGLELGIESYLMKHTYNEHKNADFVTNWKDIYERLEKR